MTSQVYQKKTKSFAVELTQDEVDWIKARYNVDDDTKVRRIIQSFVNEKLPIDIEQTLKRIRG